MVRNKRYKVIKENNRYEIKGKRVRKQLESKKEKEREKGRHKTEKKKEENSRSLSVLKDINPTTGNSCQILPIFFFHCLSKI